MNTTKDNLQKLEIEELREKLNKLLVNAPLNCSEVLQLSEELDKLINDSYQGQSDRQKKRL